VYWEKLKGKSMVIRKPAYVWVMLWPTSKNDSWMQQARDASLSLTSIN
jgi:hypothetical protein